MFWMTCSLNYTLISFLLKYFPGSINFNSMMSATSELVGTMASGLMLIWFDARLCLRVSYLLSAVGGMLMLSFLKQTNFYHTEQHTFSTAQMLQFGGLVLIVKFGNSAAFNILYCVTSSMFPTLFSITAFSISNFLARSCTFFSPQIAEIQSYFPIGLMTCLFLVSAVLTNFLHEPNSA